jgi:hypothetical protein
VRRGVRGLLVLLAVAACLPAVANARRAAHGRQASAILKAAGLGANAPVKCFRIYISTVNTSWSTATFGGSLKGGCSRVASNGVVVLHFKKGRWRVVTDGSSFTCPLAGHIPTRVQHDLKLSCIPMVN